MISNASQDGDHSPRVDATRFPLRPEPEWLAASRPCAFGVAQCGPRERAGRPAAAAHRGYRSAAFAPRVRSRDIRGSRLARAPVGRARAPAIRRDRPICRGAGWTEEPPLGLSLFLHARGTQAHGRRARDRLARGPGRNPALRRPMPRYRTGRGGAPHRIRRAARVALVHGSGAEGSGRSRVMAVMGSRRRFDRACRRQTRRMGRCRAWPQGRTDQLPPVGGARRCAAGRLPCRARSGPVWHRRTCTPSCSACSACRPCFITTTGCFWTRTAPSSPRARTPSRSGNGGPVARRPIGSGGRLAWVRPL